MSGPGSLSSNSPNLFITNILDKPETIEENFLVQHITFPTHDCGNILDLAISNIPNRISSIVDCGKLGTSDHSVLLMEIEGKMASHAPKHSIWNFKLANFKEIQKAIRDIKWQDTLIYDIEKDWDIFKTTLMNLCNKYIPKKTMKEIKQPG